MAHREELSDGLDWRIHGEEWIGGSADGETHHAPKRTDTHRHAQGRHQSEGKDTEALAGQYAQNAQQYDGCCTSRMRESQYIIDVELEEQEDAQEDERLRKHLAGDGEIRIVVRHSHPVFCPVEFQLRSYRIRCNQEDEQHDESRHHHARQIIVVVGVRVAYHVQIHGDRLQEGHDFIVRLSQCRQLRHTCCSSSQGGNGLQIPEEQGACCQRNAAVVEGNLRLSGSHQSCLCSVRNHQEGIDFVLLDSMSCLGYVFIVSHHLGGLESVELMHQLAGGMRIVLVNDAHRHIRRHTSLHQGSEENHHHDGEDDHAEEIDGILPHDAALSTGNMI